MLDWTDHLVSREPGVSPRLDVGRPFADALARRLRGGRPSGAGIERPPDASLVGDGDVVVTKLRVAAMTGPHGYPASPRRSRMTSGSVNGESGTCHQCAGHVRPDDNFCPHCRGLLSTTPFPPDSAGTNGNGPTPPQDGTTRYLCAAAQMDQAFADGAIAEYLVEQVRAVPPSPGVDAGAVLREAVAARARRRIRDGVLLGLLVVLGFVSLTTLIVWLVVALLAVSIVGAATDWRRRLAGLAVVAGALPLAVYLLPNILELAYPDGYGYGSSGSGGWMLGNLLLLFVIFGVLFTDTLTVHWLVTERFRRGTFVPDHRGAMPPWERMVRGLGHQRFGDALNRVAAADAVGRVGTGDADVIVHRGARPFIGAGRDLTPQIVALPLDPDTDRKITPDPIDVIDLHQQVAAALDGLRSSSSLSPERRLEGLYQREQVLVPADRLVAHYSQEPWLLPDLGRAPLASLPLMTARQLASWPREWARYYRCFRIESWERELTTSCYFYAGTDQSMLYLEWTHCVLAPIQKRFRSIDYVAEPGSGPFATAVTAMLQLPATVVQRLRSVFHQFTPLPQRHGEIVPERYGAARSLRELAADTSVQTYFQAVDAIRYVKIIDTALFRAVGDFLQQRGYSVVEFQKFASATITNNTMNVSGGTHIGNTMGAGNVTGGGTTRTGPVGGSE